MKKLTTLLMVLLAGAMVQAQYVSVDEQSNEWFYMLHYAEDYCSENDISDYCTEEAFDQLLQDVRGGLLDDIFINELAFTEEAIYDGPLEITSIEAVSDVGDPLATVSARYVVTNTGDEEVTARFAALQGSMEPTVRENGIPVALNFDGFSWDSTFGPREQKEFSLDFDEASLDSVYGYNINLLIDERVPVDQLAAIGSFTLLLPAGAQIQDCLPEGYVVDIVSGRPKVLWTRTDFVPWTNPFNDLVCGWYFQEGEVEAVGPEEIEEAEEEQPVDYFPYIIGGVVILLILVIVFGRRK